VIGFIYEFKGKPEDIVLIPGWGFDHRVFSGCGPDFNVLSASCINPVDFADRLNAQLSRVDSAVIAGWSMGAAFAADFAVRFPHKVKKLVLVSAKETYQKKEIGLMKELLRKDKRTYLELFYRKCLRGQTRPEAEWFNSCLKESLIVNSDTNLLLEQLDHLSGNSFPKDAIAAAGFDIAFVHGKNDAIIPASAGRRLAKECANAPFIVIDAAGHMPFLGRDFQEVLR
jgi:pimeloyl-ACP methyl ester carboxylesterase